ncbi:MAG TPA: XdhC/CoxI family protein, partial [Desulfobacterales bacterium]|nr:XdhC/CoxI family protein [Desulfobacterales bacterium]
LLGSSRKRDAFFATLGKEGVDESTLSRIHVPVGLDIGAETPAEIAVSIMAQLIAGQRKR